MFTAASPTTMGVQYAAAMSLSSGHVFVLLNGVYSKMRHAEYYLWRSQQPNLQIIAESSFPFASTYVFESLLTPQFRLENMWRKDLLAFWCWRRNKTGINTSQERLEVLMQIVHAIVIPRQREDATPAAPASTPCSTQTE